MPIIFVCPACRHRVKVSRRYAGVTRDCPACRGPVRVPELMRTATGVDIGGLESSDELVALGPLTLDDETFVDIAQAVGFPEKWKLEHYRKLREERARAGKEWTLLRLMCANDAVSSEQEEHFERIARLLAGMPPTGARGSVVDVIAKLSKAGVQELSESERELRERAELIGRYAAPRPANPDALMNTLFQTRGPEPGSPLASEPTGRTVSDDRECPRCAELIKVRAKICRFCGASFEAPSATIPAATVTAPSAPAPTLAPPPKKLQRSGVARLGAASSAARVPVIADPRRQMRGVLLLVIAAASVTAIGAFVRVEPPAVAPPPPPSPRAAEPEVELEPLVRRSRPSPSDRARRPVPVSMPVDDAAEVARILEESRRLRASSFERQAAKLLEAALEEPRASRSIELLREARDALYAECRDLIDVTCADVAKAALAKDMVGARFMLGNLTDHVPDALVSYEEERVEKINALLRARWGEGLEGDPRDVERYGRARPELDAALAGLDVSAARRIVDRLAGVNVSPRTISSLEFDARRIVGVTALKDALREALVASIGTDAEFPLAAGGRACGRLVELQGEDLSLDLGFGGQRRVKVGELASTRLGELVARAREDARFGLAVVVVCRGDRGRAVELLDALPEHADARRLRSELVPPERLEVPRRR